jgi:G3E family GTPase
VFTRDPLAGRIPVTLITGFLGSGKTTLLSRLVRHPAMAGAAVVINEVGEIGIDHDLVTMASENVALLANGCICCSVRTDLQETLRDLFARRHSGEIPDFDRLIIETTGLADPAPVVHTLASDTLLAAQFRLDGLVTLVDGAQALQQLAAHGEPAKQIALADRVFITKADLVDEAQRQAVEQAVRALNPRAPFSTLLHGEVDPAELTGLGLASARASPATLSFLGEPLAGDGASGERHLGQRPALHDASIRTLSLRFETPFAWPAFSAALELLTTLRGPDLLRVKGIVNVEGQPVVVQGVQHIFHDPVELDRWPSADTGTRLVFITRGIDAATIRNLLSAVAAASPASNPVSTPGR